MPPRERILAFGKEGSSKTYQWLCVAEYLFRENPSSAPQFWVLSTDDSVPRMLTKRFAPLDADKGGNVHVFDAYDWEDYLKGQAWMLEHTNPERGDWLVVDLVDSAWKSVTEYFTRRVWEEDIGEYFLKVRKQMADKEGTEKSAKSKSALKTFDGWKDWSVINKLYDSWINPILYKSRSNLWMCAKVSGISKDEDADTRDLYGPYGVKPAGQKDLGYQMHTVFLFSQGDKLNTWTFSTVKDRERKMFDHNPLMDIVKQYFIPVVGWE